MVLGRPTQTAWYDNRNIFIQKEIFTCSHVSVGDDTVRPGLKQPYEVVKRYDKAEDKRQGNKCFHWSFESLFMPVVVYRRRRHVALKVRFRYHQAMQVDAFYHPPQLIDLRAQTVRVYVSNIQRVIALRQSRL